MGISFSLPDARFLFDRATGLFRRGLISLRTRGWRASWERTRAQFRRVPAAQRVALHVPETTPFAPFALATGDIPRASVVIPVYNQFAHTTACLRALAAHPPQVAFEVIVVDDGSSDETVTALPQIAGLRYHRRAANGGFIAACNDGAAQARGETLVFLNNDTVPQPGWLDALLRTFDEHPDAGLVGAQLLYPDGTLQEAGGVIRHDGSADNLGRFASPLHPMFGYSRRVDYCSGAAIAIPRALFGALGGFDAAYSPAYYEDADLAFKVRASGRQVVYQPAASVIHFEGTTSGNDTRRGVKAYQEKNHAIFRSRWASVLDRYPDHDLPAHRLTDRHYPRRVLFIDALTPRPDRDSGSLRLINLMHLLREHGAHVAFLPANGEHAGHYTETLQQSGVEAWYLPFAKAWPAWLREHAPRFDVVVVCRYHVAREFLPLLRRYASQARIVFDTVDLHYLREQRAAALSKDAILARAAAHTRTRELEVIARSDLTLVVSDTEKTLLARDAPQACVEVLSNLHRVAGAGRPFEQRKDLVFVGGFRHPPNIDAVRWFVGTVFPSIRSRLPDVRFHCIGGDVPPEIQALSMRDGVTVHGHVPDIAPYMDGCRVAIAPLRFGAGVKGKINLSMAHGQPVVATACAVEGMYLRDGHDVLVADDADAFADAVVRLYRDEALWRELSANGLHNIATHFSMDAARDTVRRVFFA